MTIVLELETEARLIQEAQEQGKQPEEYAAELLRSGLFQAENSSHFFVDEKGWLRDERNHLLGFDGLTWRQMAHLDHKY